MIDLGDTQIGQEIPVSYQITGPDGPLWPDAAPQLVLYHDGDLVRRVKMPCDSQSQRDGLFRYQLFLDAAFPVGDLYGFLQWAVGGDPHAETVKMRILPGGSADGSAIAVACVRRPSANYLVFQCDSGTIFKGTNPRVQ